MPQIIWRAVHFRKMSCDLGLTGKAPEIRAVFRTRRQSPDAENAWLGREDSNSRKRGEVRSMSPEQKETSPWSNAQAGRILTCFTAAAFLANPPPGWARLPKERQFRGRANPDRPSTSSCRAIFRCDHRVMPTLECLGANGFPEAAERIDQPHIHKELKDIADAARKQAVGLSTERPD